MNEKAARIMSKVVLADRPVQIKLLGDSITHGVGGTGWEQCGEPITAGFARSPYGFCWAKCFRDHMEARYNCAVTNNACTGTTIEFILGHFDELVSPTDDIVLCAIGTNNRHQYYRDAPMHTPGEHMRAFYAHILELHDRFLEAGKDVIFIANIPASAENEKDGPDYARLFHMSDVHDMYVKAAALRGFALISLYNGMLRYCDAKGVPVDDLLSDGLHPNDRGHAVMFRLLMEETGLALGGTEI